MSAQAQRSDNVSLVEALDRVLDMGAVVAGDVVIRVADIDLVYAGLRLVLSSVARAEEFCGQSFTNPQREATPEDIRHIQALKEEIRRAEENIPRLIDAADPEQTEKGIARLVLTLVELIRKVMEKEGYRRMKRGTLSPAQIEKLGLSLKAVKRKTQEMQAVFGIEDDELGIDLGPLGNLM